MRRVDMQVSVAYIYMHVNTYTYICVHTRAYMHTHIHTNACTSRLNEAGIINTEKITELQRMVEMEQETSSSLAAMSASDQAELQAHKNEIARLQLEVDECAECDPFTCG